MTEKETKILTLKTMLECIEETGIPADVEEFIDDIERIIIRKINNIEIFDNA